MTKLRHKFKTISNDKIISSQFQAAYFASERGTKKEHSHSYVTDEVTKFSDKRSASNEEIIILSLLKITQHLNDN